MSTTDSGRAGMLISTAWLTEHAADSDVRIVDMRGQVATAEPAPGVQEAIYRGRQEDYRAGHIPGAIYLDWTRDLVDPTDPVPAQAARAEHLAATLGRRGIGDQHLVVAYDDAPNAQFATRLWWLLNLYGHERVAVLDGGLLKWQREGRAVTTLVPQWPAAVFTPRLRPGLRVDAEEVRRSLGHPDVRLLDARDERQYSGTLRRGKRGGHIPGAIHVPRETVVEGAGTFRHDDALDETLRQAGVAPSDRLIAYCNGGVAATSVLFSLAMRGYPLDRLANYDGSWNEWGNRDDLPVTAREQL